jgi:hypothetical protein
MREQDFKVICTKPYVYCKVFEDNNAGILKLARLPMQHPRTKHINICYHHFHKHVCKGLINIFSINTKDQIADALTKLWHKMTSNVTVAICAAASDISKPPE